MIFRRKRLSRFRKQLEPQFIHAINDIKEGRDPDIGQGPLKEVDPAEKHGVYMGIRGPRRQRMSFRRSSCHSSQM